MTDAPSDLSTLPPPDQQEVGKTRTALLTGFSTRDAAQLTGVYTGDADWVNAFGSVKKGSAEIVDYLSGLFADGNFTAGRLAAPPESTIRVLTAEVVLCSTHLRIEGQKLMDGSTLDRETFSLPVLQRQADGSWLIVSEMYMDANTAQS
ncbi:MAG TPA: DUF4440 domain-containing protein [Dermatophilaceae bacterium]|nr:DUF4440 domain-containing protein [Dermatophilaceae bacterium]